MSKKFISSNKIYTSKSKISGAGRGVFAKIDIKKGEIVETCPIVKVPFYDLEKTANFLLDYTFFSKNGKRAFLALGFGSLYNHSDIPNASYKINQKEKIIVFKAKTNIKKGEEITFDYKGKSKLPLWFEN